jgi:Mg-chelatase subunit ChlD
VRARAILLLIAALAVPAAAEPVDLVVMVDVSASMSPYFSDVVEYFVADIMRGMLQSGDRFHLLTFAGLPEVQVSNLAVDGGDRALLERRVRQFQPIGLHTDLVAAVTALRDYTAGLPQGTSRQILLITDGIHDPAPDSPNAGDQAQAIKRLLEGARSIKKAGWYVHILGMPPGADAAGRTGSTSKSLVEDLARETGGDVTRFAGPTTNALEAAAAGMLQVTWPGPLGAVGRSFALPLRVTNRTSRELRLTLSGVTSSGTNILDAPHELRVRPRRAINVRVPLTLPASLADGAQTLSLSLETTGAARLYPRDGVVTLTLAPAAAGGRPAQAAARQTGQQAAPQQPGQAAGDAAPGPTSGGPTSGASPGGAREPGRFAAIGAWAARTATAAAGGLAAAVSRVSVGVLVPALLLLAAILAAALIGIRLTRHGAAPPSRPVARRSEKGPLIELQVSLQNSKVGFRNIRGIEPGRKRTVGGGWSAFLIFLVPLPRRIAEIHFDGHSYSFRVVKTKFFPDAPETIEECLGVDIPLVSDKGFPIVIRFVRYISPLERIHGLLRAVYEQGARSSAPTSVSPPPVDTAHRFL